jgi:twitching motility protein PilT
MDISELLLFVHKEGASDLHISAGEPPMVRIYGEIKRIEIPPLTREDLHVMLYDVLNDHQRKKFEEMSELDFSLELKGVARFRVNAFRQQRGDGVVFRVIPQKILSLEQLGLPKGLREVCQNERGLVLVTGPTGSGKSTTLAAMIDVLNNSLKGHVITIEDPIEFVHESKNCLINQREVGAHTLSFSNALRSALREDPDIILVGEMRDLETTSAAITAAETGHLVLSTLHTNSASQTIERIIDIYPASQQNQIRSQLSNTLEAVITQTLFKRIDQPGMIPAAEVMICNAAVRNCVRENRVYEIPNIIETNRGLGMCTLDSSIKTLYFNGHISREDALAAANRPDKLEQALSA